MQRDLLPILEGSTVHTRYGPVRTDHVLFIAAGAFTAARPSDLIPEFQGRFPIRVELKPLSEDDLVRILTEPGNALTRQYAALLGTERVTLDFTPDGIRELAAQAYRVNEEDENLGARRLFTIMEKVLEDVSFDAEDLADTTVVIDCGIRREAARGSRRQPGPPPLRPLAPHPGARCRRQAGLVHSGHLTRSVSRGRRVPGVPRSPSRFTPSGGTTPPQQERPPMPAATLRQLLEAGVHFGHQTSRWNPRMRPYIFTARNGIHIIDLEQTQKQLDVACDYLRKVVADGQKVLFVGTKKQAQDVIEEVCRNTGQAYVTHRWMGGMLTNFTVIQRRLRRLAELRVMQSKGDFERMSGKEANDAKDDLERLENNFAGMADMKRVPGAVFVIDCKKEHIAVNEANKLGIPIVAIVDTNCDPDDIQVVIPGNDDAMRSCRLIVTAIGQAITEGLQQLTEREMLERQEAEKREREAAAAAEVAAALAAEAAAADAAHADAIAAEAAAAEPAADAAEVPAVAAAAASGAEEKA